MKAISTFLCTFLLFFVFNANAQSRCGADDVRSKLIAADPAYKATLDAMDRDIQQYINTHPPTATSFTAGTLATLYYIPCVVHVIHDNTAIGSPDNPTDATIIAAIDYINKVYDGTWTGTGGAMLSGDLQIKFVLATKDTLGNVTTGIERINGQGVAGYSAFGMKLNGASGASEAVVKDLSRWDPAKYYNIWTVNKIDGCTGTFCGCACDAGFVAGYAYFPMSPLTSTANYKLDGTLMLATQFKAGQKTLPHELGHALNLYHTFEGVDGANTCPVNASPSTQGDQCADTDPVTNPTLAPNPVAFACRTGNNPCTLPLVAFNDNTEKNYMNYTSCYQLFTNDQKNRMLASAVSTQRSSLASSWANNQGSYPAAFAAPPAASVTPVTQLTANASGVLAITLNGRTVYSLSAVEEGGNVNKAGKWYDAFQLLPNTTYTMTVLILNSTNRYQLGVWIDYNRNGVFNSTNEQLYLQNDVTSATSTTTVSIPFTTPSGWGGGNQFVRLRVATDLSFVYGGLVLGATTPTLKYGQVEDYPVYLTGAVVPVALTAFTGVKNTDAINLKWNTATELNTASFDIERSVNGKAYEVIGNVHATGSAAGADYTFRDADVSQSGTYLYRLKIKDNDGSSAYSDVLSFKIADAKKLIVYGNPFKDNIHMQLPYSTGSADFKLTDAAGRIVYHSIVTLSGSSNHSLMLEKSNPAKGLYILDAIINGQRFTQKLIKE